MVGLETGWIWAEKMVYPELVKTGYLDQIWKIQKRSGYRLNRFRPVFEFDISYFVRIPYLSDNTKMGG